MTASPHLGVLQFPGPPLVDSEGLPALSPILGHHDLLHGLQHGGLPPQLDLALDYTSSSGRRCCSLRLPFLFD